MEHGAFDPLNILPYEIWVNCIQIYARNQSAGPLPLLAVSPYWQKCLLEEPKLWTYIYLDGGHDEKCRVESFFQLSKRVSGKKGVALMNSLPVNVVLDRDSSAMEAVIRHKDRIKSLTFGTKSIHRYSGGHIAILSQALSVCNYPNLIQINVDLPRYAGVVIPRNLIEACPALIGVYGAYVQQENISFLSISTIRLGISGNGVLEIGAGDRLETLRVLYTTAREDSAHYRDYFTVSTTRLKFFEIEFGEHPHTVTMGRPLPATKGSHHLIPIQAFISTSHDSLTILSLKMPWYEISFVTYCLSSCRSLRELELTLSHSSTDFQRWSAPPLTVDDLGRVRKLYLALSPPKSSAEGAQKALAKNLALIIQLFAEKGALQFLEELRLALPDKDMKREILNLLRGARSLKELYWGGAKPPVTGQNLEKVLLVNVHTLFVQYGGDLQYLDAPNLICLECHVDLLRVKGNEGGVFANHLPSSWAETLESIVTPNFFLHRWNDILVTEGVDDNPFSRVIMARFITGPFDYQPMVPLIFTNLRSVFFDGRANHTAVSFMREITGDSILNHFMLEMLVSPDVCPRLHTIRATLFPNWAVAVALFHRRNTIKKVSPITSFWLHGYPHTRILELVVKALSPERGDTEDIAAAIAVDEILHRRWEARFFRDRACQDCLMSGYVSCVPNSVALHPTNPAPLDRPAITELLELHFSVEKVTLPIIYTREFWEAHLRRTIIAVGEPDTPRCKRHGRRTLEHIGPYTLDGVTYDAF